MFGVYVNNGDLKELPSDDVAYIICNDQIFLKKKFGLVDAVVPVQKIQLFNQNELKIEPSAKLNIPKISKIDFQNVFSFFREIYERDKSEAIVRLYYDSEYDNIVIYCPDQQNVGMAAKSKIDLNDKEVKEYLHIGDIHSHCSMSGFHSGTDVHDEEKYSGLHLTIGNVNKDEFSIAASIVVNNVRIVVDPLEYVEGLKLDEKNKFCFENEFKPDSDIVTKWMIKVRKPEPPNDPKIFDRNKLFNSKSELLKRSFRGWNQREIQDYFEDSKYSVFNAKYDKDAFDWLGMSDDLPKVCQYCKHNPNLGDDIGSDYFELDELNTDIDEIIEEDDDGILGYYDESRAFISLNEIEEIKEFHKQNKSKGEDQIRK